MSKRVKMFALTLFSVVTAGAQTNGEKIEASLTEAVLLLAAFGALGGIAAALAEVNFRELREKGISAYGSAGRLIGSLVIGAVWGVGGAFAFGAVLAADSKFDNFTGQRQIMIAFLSVAAGFAGLHLLNLVSKRIRDQVEAEVNKKAGTISSEVKQEVREEVIEVKSRLTEQNQKLEVLNDALHALTAALSMSKDDPNFPVTAREALRKAENCRRLFPVHRTLAIYFGRLKKMTGGCDEAILALNAFISEWRRSKAEENADFAALLFNRACYKNLNAEALDAQHATEKGEKFRADAWNDLVESCRIDPENVEDAKVDRDLASLFNSESRTPESLKNSALNGKARPV